MFKHVLLPTDGSALSDIAIAKGIALAKAMHAQVTGIHVVPKFDLLTYHAEPLRDLQIEHLLDAKQHSDQYLADPVLSSATPPKRVATWPKLLIIGHEARRANFRCSCAAISAPAGKARSEAPAHLERNSGLLHL